VRWTEDERAALVRRCRSLRIEHPAASISELLDKGQEALSPERRRTPYTAMRAWIAEELQRAARAPSEVNLALDEVPVTPTDVAPVRAPSAADVPSVTESALAKSNATPSPLIASLVEIGVQIVLGILTDSRVRAAVSAHDALPPPAPAEPDDARRCIVVAGIPSSAIEAVEKALNGTLELRFWSPEQPREQLQQLLPDARLVIGMPDGLSPALESSLQRLGTRYVRHSSGVAGLHRRLASEAMR
jgi:hypothetical protein